MDETINTLSKYRLEKSKNDLKVAIANYESNFYSQSLNRSYYSIFHAVRALLAFDKFDSKKHTGIISFFQLNYVKTNRFDLTFSKILINAEKVRVESDYNDFYVASKEETLNQIENAKLFIEGIEKYIMENYLV
ncbi:MAG: HEPN domain-containing protein [Ignavibacteriota bacterium]|nr:HEPN domain-containing protein [Ignavibacteriota bacterium]